MFFMSACSSFFVFMCSSHLYFLEFLVFYVFIFRTNFWHPPTFEVHPSGSRYRARSVHETVKRPIGLVITHFQRENARGMEHNFTDAVHGKTGVFTGGAVGEVQGLAVAEGSDEIFLSPDVTSI